MKGLVILIWLFVGVLFALYLCVCVLFVCFFLGEQGRGMMNERVGADTVSKMFRVCSQVHVLVGPFQPGIFYESC